MVFLRYLLIIGLSVCVCFTGYSVFQSFKTDDSQEDNYSDFATFDDAPPLFDGTPTETSSTDLVGSSPVISFPTGNDSNKIPQNPAISELEKPSVFTTGTPIIAENVESDETEETLSDLDLTFGNSFIQNIPEIGGFGYSKTFTEAFEESAALEKQFKLAEALRLLSLHLLYAENELTEEQDKQSRDKLEELAAKVIFTANKHLALPAKTYMPDQTLVSIAKEHEISVAFLKSINQFDDENLPTPGDSLKVIQGPLSVVLDTKRNQAILYADKLFVQRYDLDSANLDPSIDS
ncbi:MAG: LysM peptidoglycan-binding domain-containing protein, partial [Pirellulales bacterium]